MGNFALLFDEFFLPVVKEVAANVLDARSQNMPPAPQGNPERDAIANLLNAYEDFKIITGHNTTLKAISADVAGAIAQHVESSSHNPLTQAVAQVVGEVTQHEQAGEAGGAATNLGTLEQAIEGAAVAGLGGSMAAEIGLNDDAGAK